MPKFLKFHFYSILNLGYYEFSFLAYFRLVCSLIRVLKQLMLVLMIPENISVWTTMQGKGYFLSSG